MMQRPLQIEGTWEQIVALAPSLAGYRLRLTVLAKTEEDARLEEIAATPLSEQFAHIRADDPDAWIDLPADLAEQHDHYIYGWPKRPTR